MRDLYLDIETYSSVNIAGCGSYKYFQSPDFEILILAYSFDKKTVKVVDIAQGDKLPEEFIDALLDYECRKHAHNANFERIAFKTIGFDVPAEQWHCSAVKAGYCGLPMSLDGASKALNLGDQGKSAEGKALIRYFSCPVKPTKANGGRYRNFPKHDLEKWERYKLYCKQDVYAEIAIIDKLSMFEIPKAERLNYILDQQINDRGVTIDVEMAENAIIIDNRFKTEVFERLKQLTGLVNPNSPAQLKDWLSAKLQKDINTLAKDNVQALIKEHKSGVAVEVLKLRSLASKTSTKKFLAMVNFAADGDTAHGLLYFYGGSRTGRWAGRAVQLQNLPRNKMKLLDEARCIVKLGDYVSLDLTFDRIPDVLSQLIRTALIPKENNVFVVADYSAIEGRITAWLSGEKWRLDVFAGDGKIYEASAAAMFNIPVESIDKTTIEGGALRQKGKVAELALGFQGGVGALKTMGADKMGLSETEMKNIVDKWRAASPQIVRMWADFEKCAIQALRTRKTVISKFKDIKFRYEDKRLTIELPSTRKLIYHEALITKNQWGRDSIKYKGVNQDTKQWGWLNTYGGKLTENIIQAIARDCLAVGMRRADKAGFPIVMHVHDEVVCDIENLSTGYVLSELCRILAEPINWAPGLFLPAEGFITNYYKKD